MVVRTLLTSLGLYHECEVGSVQRSARMWAVGVVLSGSVCVAQPVCGIEAQHRSRPVPTVKQLPDWRKRLSRRKQAPGESLRPGPGRRGQPEDHSRCGRIRLSFGAALDEVPPDGREEHPLHRGIQSPAEGDGLPPVVRERVSKQGMEGIHREHGPIPRPGQASPRRALRPAPRVRVLAELDEASPAMRRHGHGVGPVPVPNQVNRAVRGAQIDDLLKDAAGGAEVPSAQRTHGPAAEPAPLSRREPAASPVRGGIDGIQEPRAGTDGRADSEGKVLRELESLEVIDDQRLGEASTEGVQGPSRQQQGVPSKARREPRHSRWSAPKGASHLPMGRSGHEPGGDRDEQLGALQEVPG